MTYLKPGTHCVIVAGCPKNIGLIVEIIAHLGYCPPYEDVCKIRTVSGRFFPQVWDREGNLTSGSSNECYTDRHKLRPLVNSKEESKVRETDVEDIRSREQEFVDCSS